MLVRFRTNLGLVDASRIHLDRQLCQADCELVVPNEAGQWLVKRGIAEHIRTIEAIPLPIEIAGVPPVNESVETATEDFATYREKTKRKAKDESERQAS